LDLKHSNEDSNRDPTKDLNVDSKIAAQQHWLDRPENIKRLWRGFLAVLVLSVLAELFVHVHGHFAVDALFGFNAGFGFLACAAMVVVAKVVALVLKRPDNYYGKQHD
jgi:hypothetical protein